MVLRSEIYVYFTHDTEDLEFINQIVEALNATRVFHVFVSPTDLSVRSRAETYSLMRIEIEKCDLFVVLFTRKSFRLALVEKEIRFAAKREKTIIPFYDSTFRMHRPPCLVGYQETHFQERNAKPIVGRILDAADVLQGQLGISAEAIRRARVHLQSHRVGGTTQVNAQARHVSWASRSVHFRTIVTQTMKKLGYSIEEGTTDAIPLFDFSASKAGRKIWIKCILGIPNRKSMLRIGNFKVSSSDEVWIVCTSCPKETEQVARHEGIRLVISDSLVGELDPVFGNPLLERLRLLQGGRIPISQSTIETRDLRNLLELIQMPEDQHLEFKASFRYNQKKKIIDPNLEKAYLKSICAFLNAEGGRLVVGISDNRQPIGLSHDYRTLKKHNRDGLENHIVNTVSSRIGSQFIRFVQVTFHTLGNKEICVLEISPSNKPAFLKETDTEEFYVRTGNSSRPFSMLEAVEYIKEHWK
jgi:hypothetical protein